MAVWKLTVHQGDRIGDVTQSAGSSISGHDAIEVNIDAVHMTQAECSVALDLIKEKVLQSNFPAA